MSELTTPTDSRLSRRPGKAPTETARFLPSEITESDWQQILDPNRLRALGPEDSSYLARINILAPDRFNQLPSRIKSLITSSYLSGHDPEEVLRAHSTYHVERKRLASLPEPERVAVIEAVVLDSKKAAAQRISGGVVATDDLVGKIREVMSPKGTSTLVPDFTQAWEIMANLRVAMLPQQPSHSDSASLYHPASELRAELARQRGEWRQFVRLAASAAILDATEIRIVSKKGVELVS